MRRLVFLLLIACWISCSSGPTGSNSLTPKACMEMCGKHGVKYFKGLDSNGCRPATCACNTKEKEADAEKISH